MSIPKEPRQQMINMMYLVLTALLALNVSAEILKAFDLVNEGIRNTINAAETKNQIIMKAFESQLEINEKQTRPLYENAQKATAISADLIKEIEKVKTRIIEISGGYEVSDGDTIGLSGAKDLNIPSQVMIFEKEGDRLQKLVQDKKAELQALVDNPVQKSLIDRQLNVENPPPSPEYGNRSWAESQFQSVPTVASVVLLSKLQNDVKNAEAEVMNYLFSQIGASDFKFDQLVARVITPSSYVIAGEEYKADIFVSASSSATTPEVYIGKLKPEVKARKDSAGRYPEIKGEDGSPLANPAEAEKLEVVGGMGRLEQKAANVGVQSYEGAIKVINPQGDVSWFPFESEYQVAKSSVVVSPDAMNVLYIGVANPLSVSVPGFPAEKLRPSMTGGGSLTKKSPGKFEANVRTTGTAVVNVSAEMPDGSVRSMGKQEFRVRRIPDPIAKVAGEPGGTVKAAVMRAQRGVVADLENFVFDIRYNIISFEMYYQKPRADLQTDQATGALFTDKMLNWIKQAKPGDQIFLDNIRAKGPDGVSRKLPTIAFKLI